MEILLLFSVVAFLYASVGHGGASGYIALMAIFAFPQSEIKSNALFLNLFVSFISFTQFFKKEEFPFKLFFMLNEAAYLPVLLIRSIQCRFIIILPFKIVN